MEMMTVRERAREGERERDASKICLRHVIVWLFIQLSWYKGLDIIIWTPALFNAGQGPQ